MANFREEAWFKIIDLGASSDDETLVGVAQTEELAHAWAMEYLADLGYTPSEIVLEQRLARLDWFMYTTSEVVPTKVVIQTVHIRLVT